MFRTNRSPRNRKQTRAKQNAITASYGNLEPKQLMAADFAISPGLIYGPVQPVTVVAIESGNSGIQTDAPMATVDNQATSLQPGPTSGTVVFETASPQQNPNSMGPTVTIGGADIVLNETAARKPSGGTVTALPGATRTNLSPEDFPSTVYTNDNQTVLPTLGARESVATPISNSRTSRSRVADPQMPTWLTLDNGVLTFQGDASGNSFVAKNHTVNGIPALRVSQGREWFVVPMAEVNKILFFGGDGNDRFVNYTNVDLEAHGQGGNDYISSNGYGTAVIYGGSGNDKLRGGHVADQIFGGDGYDSISGLGGDDLLDGGAGNDRLFGHDGHDILRGGGGHDQLKGGVGDDVIYGGAGNDHLIGSWGDDQLHGQGGSDRLDGHSGNDRLWGGNGADRLSGGYGTDVLRGGRGRDYLIGSDWEFDKLFGGKGKDRYWLNGGPLSD